MTQRLTIPDGGGPCDLEEGSVVFVDAGAVILRAAGFTVLCDPRFLNHGDHVHLGYGDGPAADVAGLPPVDFALMSRLRPDHAERRLARELGRHLPILSTPQAAQQLRQRGFAAARGLATWQTIGVERADATVRVTSVPGHHRAVPVEFFLPDVMGSVLELAPRAGGRRLRAYVSGDALEDLRDVPLRHPGTDLAILHAGDTRVLGLVRTDGERGRAALHLVAPRPSAPASGERPEPLQSPIEALAASVRESGLDAHVRWVACGEPYAFRSSDLRELPATLRRPRPRRGAESQAGGLDVTSPREATG